MKKQTKYLPPGFPITEADLLRKAKGRVSRQTLWIYRKDEVFKEGEDWIKVGSNVFYSEAVVQKIIKSTSASSAAEETCDTCPLDPSGCGNYVHKDNPRPCGSVSGGNDNPKGNLVLEAIDSAMLKPKGNKWYHQSGREEFRPSYANEALMKVKAIYLQHHPQGPDVAGRTTKYYTCPRCFAPIDMTGTGLDGLVATGNGGEFDAVMRRHYQIMNNSLLHVSKNFRDRQDVIDAARLDIENAHNADRAADKQRIAELEAQLAEWKSRLTAVMPTDFKDWHQNSKKELPQVAAWVIKNRRKHIEYLEKQVSGLEAHLLKARYLLERVVGLHVAPHDCYSTGPYFGDARDAGCPSCEALRWLELEPTPTFPETSDDMIAGDGD